MKVLLLSDTHIPKRAKRFPNALTDSLERADLILHAGDFMDMSVVKMLQRYAPVKGVYGNIDSPELKKQFSAKELITIGDFQVGLVHGHLGRGNNTPERAIRSFPGKMPEVIVFGHSHVPYYQNIDNTILYNPGSPTDKRFQKLHSFGWMTVTDTINLHTNYF